MLSLSGQEGWWVDEVIEFGLGVSHVGTGVRYLAFQPCHGLCIEGGDQVAGFDPLTLLDEDVLDHAIRSEGHVLAAREAHAAGDLDRVHQVTASHGDQMLVLLQ